MNKINKVVLCTNNDGSYTLMFFKENLEGLNVRTFKDIKTKNDKQIMINHCKLIASFMNVPFIESSMRK